MQREQCRVGMTVTFGRENGEKTVGVVEKCNPTKAKVRTTEARGKTPAGTMWNVPYSLLTAEGVAEPPASGLTPDVCRQIRMLHCTPKELAEAVMELLPAAEFVEDSTGQMVINTGLRWDGNRLRVLIPDIPQEAGNV